MTYDLSPSRARNPLIIITIFLVLAIITVIIRFRVRWMKRADFGFDDGFMLAAMVILVASVGLFYGSVIIGGVGRHMEELNFADPNFKAHNKSYLKMLLIFSLFYNFEESFIKISIICFYLRIFGASNAFRWQAYALIVALTLWVIGGTLEFGLICTPFVYNWDLSIPGGHCGNKVMASQITGGLNVATDFLTMALPISQIIHLQLPLKRKIGLVFMFSLGTFITIISVLRIQSLNSININDLKYTITMPYLWTTLEPCLCIINANLPMTRSFLATVAPGLFGSSLHNTTTISNATPTIGTVRSRGDIHKARFEVIENEDRYGYLKRGTLDVEKNRLGIENKISGGRHGSEQGSETELYHMRPEEQIVVGRSVSIDY